MNFPNLDKKLEKRLNALTPEEINSRVSWAYNHEVLWYGVEAVAHFYLMKIAQAIFKGKLSKEEIIEKYNLTFVGENSGLIKGSIYEMTKDKIFIPKQLSDSAYSDTYRHKGEISFFSSDYLNRVARDCWIDKEYAQQLINHNWQPEDLENQELIQQGIRFGKDMWATCVNGFEQYKELGVEQKFYAKNKKVNKLARGLIKYYSQIISQ